MTTCEDDSAVGDNDDGDGDGVMVGAPRPRTGAGPVVMASRAERRHSSGLAEEDLEAVVGACARLPEPEGDYLEDDFLVNLMATVVDFQLQTPAVERALRHFREVVRPGLAGIDDLLGLFDRWPATKEGNTALAEHLWGYRLWTRAQHLRDLVAYFASVGVRDQEALRAWAQTTSFAEFKGRVKGLGPAVFQWLVMRQGIETVKPDVHVHRFVAAALGRQVSDKLAVALVTEAARRLGRSALRLDWAIWEAGRAGPPSAPPAATKPTPPPARARSLRSVAAQQSGDDGAVARFLDDDEGYLAWLDEHPDGFVLNAHRRPKSSYLVLHRARCSSLHAVSRRSTPGRTWTIDFQKACASDVAGPRRLARRGGVRGADAVRALPPSTAGCRPTALTRVGRPSIARTSAVTVGVAAESSGRWVSNAVACY